MHVLPRKLGLSLAGGGAAAALAVPLAGQADADSGVLMQFFTAKPDQKWHTHPA